MQDRGALPEGALEGGHLELHILRGCRHSVDGHQDTQLGLRTPLRRRAAREEAGFPAEAMGPVGYGMAPREQESGFGRGLSGGRLPLEGGALCRGRQEGREEGTHPGAARRDLLGGVGKMAGGNPRGAAAESGEEGGAGGDGHKGIVRRHRRGAQDDVRDEAKARVCPRLRGQRRSEGDTQGPSEGERTGKARCPVPPRRQEEEDPEGTESIGN